MTAVLALHAVVALAALATRDRLGPRVFWVTAVAPALTFAWTVGQLPAVTDGETARQQATWVGELGLGLDLRLDTFSLLFVLLVAGIGTAVNVYAAGYFHPRPGLARFAATLVVFAGAMVGIVLADNLLALFVFWELTSVTSYLLIGFEDERASARGAALEAILTTGGGGLVMLAGFVLLGQAADTYSISAILASPPTGGTVGVALALVLVGAFTKSAQAPFHYWLPAAMAGPTPVSAFLHSATMVKAGVYLVARLAPSFAAEAVWRPAVVAVALTTMLLGGYRALRQYDLKLVLAFGTVSQLGLLMLLFGLGTPEATKAGVVLLVAHAAFKATLFLAVGAVDHQAGTRDLRALSGLARTMPRTFAITAVAAASMAGLPPLLGFLAKESAYEALLDLRAAWGPLVLAGVVAGSALTFAYSARLLWGGFATCTGPPDPEHPRIGPVTEAGPLLWAPGAVLATATVLFGLWPALLSPLVADAAVALDTLAEPKTLALWHGFNAALGLSALTIAAGIGLSAARAPVERAQTAAHRLMLPAAVAGYRLSLSWLNRSATILTGVVQNGSLPVYLAVIWATVLLLPGVALLRAAELPDDLRLAESPIQLLAAAAVVVTAVVVGAVRHRLLAVLLLGGVGYGVAVLFFVQGAPDLALTQLLVETLGLVIFVLVLRHLPARFEPVPWRVAQVPRILVAGAVGAFVTLAALTMGAQDPDRSVSEEMIARSLPDGGGKNVVNVILVDIRALDTLGEITVVVVAALGIHSLVRVAGRREQAP